MNSLLYVQIIIGNKNYDFEVQDDDHGKDIAEKLNHYTEPKDVFWSISVIHKVKCKDIMVAMLFILNVQMSKILTPQDNIEISILRFHYMCGDDDFVSIT